MVLDNKEPQVSEIVPRNLLEACLAKVEEARGDAMSGLYSQCSEFCVGQPCDHVEIDPRVEGTFRALRVAIEQHKEGTFLGRPSGECGLCVDSTDVHGSRIFDSFPCERLIAIAKELGVE